MSRLAAAMIGTVEFGLTLLSVLLANPAAGDAATYVFGSATIAGGLVMAPWRSPAPTIRLELPPGPPPAASQDWQRRMAA